MLPPAGGPRLLMRNPSAGTVTSVRILMLPKIEMERKPQRHFQADFIRLMLEHKGGSTEERKVL